MLIHTDGLRFGDPDGKKYDADETLMTVAHTHVNTIPC